jgi:hypothetical protein
LDEAPELLYIDESWIKRDNCWIAESERGAYVCAPSFLVSRIPGIADPVYTANPVHGHRPGEKLLEGMREYFLRRSYCRPFSGTTEEEQKAFMMEFFRMSYEAVDEAGERRLRRWLKEEHGELGEETMEFLLDLSAGAFDEVDEMLEEYLRQVRNEAIEDFRVGGQERLFDGLRKHLYPIVEERDLEPLLEAVRKDLDAGVSLAEALNGVVPTDEYGSIMRNPFVEKALFNLTQDGFRKFEGELDKLLEEQKNAPRSFYPLSSPGLFLEFAKLGGKEEITQDDVLEWVHCYGILGLDLAEHVGDVGPYPFLDGPIESVAAFAREAQEANLMKRTYEAALRLDSLEDQVVVEAFRELQSMFGWSRYSLPSLPECREKAWNAVITQVQRRLDKHCVVRWRRAGNGLVEFLEFKTLLGAMYLQFAWVLRSRADVRRCKHCGKPVEGYKNKQFCNRSCKNTFRNQLNRERRHQEILSLSVPPTIRVEVEELAAARGMDVEALFREMLRSYKDCDRAR